MVISIDKQHEIANELFETYLKENYESFSKYESGYLVFINHKRIYYSQLTLKRIFKHKNNDIAVLKTICRGDKNLSFEIILKSAIGQESSNTDNFENNDEIFFSSGTACKHFLYGDSGLSSIILNKA